MLKCIFVLPLLFILSNGVLFGSNNNKQEFSQGYRYNRPAPHYLPPHQDSSNYPQKLNSQSSIWQPIFLNHNYDDESQGPYGKPTHEMTSSNFDGYKYMPMSTSKPFYEYTDASSTGYSYMQPQSSEVKPEGYKPTWSIQTNSYIPPLSSTPLQNQYNYMTSQYSDKKEQNYRPVNSYKPPSSSSNGNRPSYGYNYTPSQSGTLNLETSEGYNYMNPYSTSGNMHVLFNRPIDSALNNYQSQSENKFNSNYMSKPMVPANQYLPPKLEFQPPYYK